MFAYWIMLAVPAAASMFERHRSILPARMFPPIALPTAVAYVMMVAIVGLRYEVGGDWFTYLEHYYRAAATPFSAIGESGDYAYVLLNWLASRMGAGVWLVNLVCAALFFAGVYVFCQSQPRPWLALCAAVPYLILVVSMGYTRQGVAIGLAMIALTALARNRPIFVFFGWLAVAALFHKSALLLAPLAAFAQKRGRWWNVAWTLSAAVIGYFTLLEGSLERFQSIYIEREYASSGAGIRVIMNAIPAAIFLLLRRRLALSAIEKRIWTTMSALSLAMIPALLISASSTAVDRAALYMIPIQLLVLCRVPDVLSPSRAKVWVATVVLYSAAVQWTWLNFAVNAEDWIPYATFLM